MNLVPQFGFLELIVIGVIALVVIGPRDLPRLMRQFGRLVAKAKAMASEFTAAFDQMARESEMEELRKEIEALKSENIVAQTKRDIDQAVKPVQEELQSEIRAINEGDNPSRAQRTHDAAES